LAARGIESAARRILTTNLRATRFMRDTVDRGNDRVMKMTGWGREIKTTP